MELFVFVGDYYYQTFQLIYCYPARVRIVHVDGQVLSEASCCGLTSFAQFAEQLELRVMQYRMHCIFCFCLS